MKFGCCIGLDPRRLEILNKYGYTCYETGFAGAASSPDEKILAMRDKASELGMTCVSHNGMFPGDFKLLGGKDEYAKISEFLDMAFAKVKPLASPVVVLGSGAARKIPDDMSLEEAKERFIALLSDVIAPMARKYNATIAIEELRREECNFINNCREAMEIIRAVDKPEIALLIDYYHAMLGGDKLTELSSYGSAIKHVHIASPKNERKFPNIDDIGDYRSFFAALKTAGYDGAISLEGHDGGNFESSLAEAISVMKEALVSC